MICTCGAKMKCVDTRAMADNRGIRRRHVCACGRRIGTVEREVAELRNEAERFKTALLDAIMVAAGAVEPFNDQVAD